MKPEMDIGDILTVRGERFWVRGFDPIGARPRLVYLREVKSGKPRSVEFDESLLEVKSGVLHLSEPLSQPRVRKAGSTAAT